MRTVYVDVLITVNFMIDLMLILCVRRFLHIKTKLWRVILSAVLGGFLSLIALLPSIPAILNILLDITSAALLVTVAFGKTDFKSFIKRTILLFSVSFFFCGIMVFVYTAFKPKGMEVYNDVVYFNISPILLIILTLVCYYLMLIFQKFSKGKLGKQICTVNLSFGNSEAEFSAMIDTGCEVKEPFSGEYVIIAEKSCLESVTSLPLQKRVIPFDSLGGKGILDGIKADGIKIDSKEITNRIYIGICDGVLKGDVKAIVPYAIVKDLNVR